MEHTTQIIGKGITYNPFSTTDKHYFGGYFNLADNNVNEVFAELNQRLNTKLDKNHQKTIELIFNDTISLTDYERLVKALSLYFPIVRFIDKKSNHKDELYTKSERVDRFKKTFIALLDTIEKLRNYYTHYYHEPIHIDDDVILFLDNALFTTIVDVKKNYLKTDHTRELLSKNLQEELERLYTLKIDFLEKKKKEIDLINAEKKAKGEAVGRPFKFGRGKEEVINSLYNDVFKQFLFDDGNQTHLKAFYATRFNNFNKPKDSYDFELPISQSGIVFLLSCFLNRKEIEDFKSNLYGYKAKVIQGEASLRKNNLLFMATHRIFSIHAYKGLKHKIRTSQQGDKETLLMQLLDEISKVPHIVYEHVSPDLQRTFVEDWNEYYKDNEENEGNLENSKVIHPVLRKRYKDKFNYFAIRFLDEYGDFPTLRFQVNIGNYLHHKMGKQIAGTTIFTDREIKEKITVFGKINEINQAKANYFHRMEEINRDEETMSSSWELFPNPSYDFPKENTEGKKPVNSGKIGIRVKLKDPDLVNKIQEAREELNTSKRKNGKLQKREIIGQIIQLNEEAKTDLPIIYQGQPTAYLSMNDIHALLYDFLIKGRTGKELEDIIVNKIENQILQIINQDTSTKILKRHQNKTDLSLDYDKLEEDLKSELSKNEKLILEQQQRQIEYNQSQNDKRHKPQRKHILNNSEKGRIAMWIANDLKRFMPDGFKREWKGYQHSELQRSLAYYEVQQDVIAALLKDWDIKKNLPFSANFSKPSLSDFYEIYLMKRKAYLEEILLRINGFRDDTKIMKRVLRECFVFLKQQKYTIQTLPDVSLKILAMPVFLERGLFDEKPTIIKGKSFAENKSLFADWFVYYKDYTDYQSFYDIQKYPLDQEKSIDWRKVTTKIKKQQRNDVFALLMAQYIFRDLFKEKLTISLKEVFQTRKEREENQQKATQNQEKNRNYIWNKTIDITLFKNIQINDVKLKDVGNFRKYENDIRVRTMLSYEPDRKWLAYLPNERDGDLVLSNVIERQIDQYEQIRSEDLLREVQRLEEYVYHHSSETQREELKKNGHPNFKKYIENGLLKNIKGIEKEVLSAEDKDKVEVLVFIRNKFSHNQFPPKWVFEKSQIIMSLSENEYYANYYLNVFKQCVNDMMNFGK